MKIEVELSDLISIGKGSVTSAVTRLIGKNVLIRTVTMIYAGNLKEVSDQEFVLTKAVWVPQTKRWAETAASGTFEECEPYPEYREVFINRSTLLDIVEVESYDRKQK